VTWHAGSAVLAYDAQIAAAGITTVFDCFRTGSDEMDTRLGFGETYLPLADAVASAAEAGLLRAEHRTHARCEVAAPNVVAVLEAFLASHPAHLISLMDHTPGQRQFRDFEKYLVFTAASQGGRGRSSRRRRGSASASLRRGRLRTAR
jgi:alpha-D-ribose 1-methylphosphonate 5-triphosphate diphosphatase